jgi:hypothetical protein
LQLRRRTRQKPRRRCYVGSITCRIVRRPRQLVVRLRQEGRRR